MNCRQKGHLNGHCGGVVASRGPSALGIWTSHHSMMGENPLLEKKRFVCPELFFKMF